MSDRQNNNKTRISARERRTKLVARILAGILAFLMIGGSAYSLIYILLTSSSAADFSSSSYGGALVDDVNIRIGLMYEDGVTQSFQTTAPYGYTLGSQPLADGVFDFAPFWQIGASTVTVAADANLAKTSDGYAVSADPYASVIGGYHIEFLTDYPIAEAAALTPQIDMLNGVLQANGLYAYPSYVGGLLRIRAGSFTTYADAEALYPVIMQYLPMYPAYITEPSYLSVTVIDPSSDRILFSYDTSDGTSLGLAAVQTGGSTNYIKSPANNVYDGVFAYSRHISDTADGIAVTNVLTLDQYVQGVLPYEISASWPIETQSAFAIAARSYAASSLGRHQSVHGFDLCNAAHCQAYHGAARVNAKVVEATTRTHGLIIEYNGSIASTYYSSSCGGVTVSINEVWGGAKKDYLVAHATPWERYADSDHYNGFWKVEVSPTELYNYLVNTKGYSALAGGSYITAIEPIAYATNSTYVKTLRITANNGASVTINNTDSVRTALSAYLKSANFVVGQGSVAYTVDKVEVLGDTVIDNAVQKQVLGPKFLTSAGVTSEGFVPTVNLVSVLRAAMESLTTLVGAPVLTATGVTVISGDTALVLTAENASAYANGTLKPPSPTFEQPPLDVPITHPQTVKEYTVHTESATATASSPENFIFVGKGWGHGAGMSQYGANDLGELGYDYEQIINAYFTNVTIVYYKELDKFKDR